MTVLNPEIYTIAWIAPLEIEARAALLMLDKHHEGCFPLGPGDDYIFEAGEVCNHNVIIATLPDDREYGTGAAAAIASHVKTFFPNLRLGLLVGVAAGLPNLQRDIRLGDVLVAWPEGDNAGLIAYDLGKETGDNGFQPLRHGHILAQTKKLILSAMKSIRVNPLDDTEVFLPYYKQLKAKQLKDKQHNQGLFADPGQENDVLFDIDDQGNEYQVSREPRPNSRRTRVWYGPIGTGEKLMKNARKRNELRDRYNIIGLEMEAAGTMNCIPVGVIRGVCDYGDEHKSKQWQPYAAAMAACYAKAVLAKMPPKVVVRVEGQTIEDDSPSEIPSRPKRPLDNSSSSSGSRKSKSPRNDNSDTPFSQPPPIQQECLDEDRTQTLLQSLAFDQIDSRHDTIKKAYGRTCEWLSTTAEYLAWLDPNRLEKHHGFLWIKGNPGAGKSTLMKFALQVAQKSKQSNCISFFFNARGDDLEKSTAGMYRSLLFQLLEKIPRLQLVLNSLRQSVLNENSPQWSLESLKSLFEQAIESLDQSSLTCFIDALDECDDAEIREMVSFFEDLGEMTVSRSISFRVCLSSRHYPHITISKGLTLDLGQQQGHDQDIIKYVNGKLKVDNCKLAQTLRKGLIEKASGVFIWVILVTGILQQEHDDGHTHNLLKRLGDIPRDLNELFRDILTRDSRHKTEVLLCIQWVLFARQPLRKEQLYLAIRIGVNPTVILNWDSNCIKDADVRRFILSSSKGLVEISRSKKSPKVQFIHESVREFFFKEDFTKLWPELNGNIRRESHERLKQCCYDYMKLGVTYLSLRKQSPEPPDRITIEKKFPLLEYTFRNVLYHADTAASGGIDQANFLQNFDLHGWVQCESIFEQFAIRRHKLSTSLLYILAEYNTANLIGYHEDKLCGFQEEKDSLYRMPILAAIVTNSHQAVYALMKAQADTKPPSSILHKLCEQYAQKKRRTFAMREFKFSKHKTLLSNLFDTGEDLVVLFLLATPATLNHNIVRNRAINTQILHNAVESGRENLVRQLLYQDGIIDGIATDGDGKTALERALLENYEEIVQLCLGRKGMVEANFYEAAALLLATKKGDEAIVRLLLRHGVNTSARSIDGNTPLHYAAQSGHTAIVQLLLDKGAVIDTITITGATALLLAAQTWQSAVVRVLLDNGANTELSDYMWRTPLAVTIPKKFDMSDRMMEGRRAIVQLLLDRGAKTNLDDRNGDSALSLAMCLSFNDPVRPLIIAEHIKREAGDSTVI